MSDFNIDQLLPQGGESSPQTQTPLAPVDDGLDLEIAPGKTERFTKQQLADFYKGHLRQEDYTRKTQQLAREREQLEQAVPQIQRLYSEHQALVQLVEDKEKLSQWMKERFKDELQQGQAPAAVDMKAFQENEKKIAALYQQVSQLQNSLREAPQHTRAEIETAQLSDKLDAHLSTVFSNSPILGAIDNAEDILRFKVFNRNPQTLDEAKKFFTEEAQKLVDKVTKAVQPQQATPAVSPQKSAGRAIEPPGGAGSAPPAQPSYKGKDGRIDFNKVGDAADEYLRQYKQNNP